MKNAKLILGSAALVSALGMWEGRLFTPYQDIGGIWTVCAGITGPEVIPGKAYSLSKCHEMEKRELARHQQGILACIKAEIGQSTLDGLSLFAYNVGIAAACNSTAFRKLNAGDLSGACDELLRWSKVKGNFVKGLWNRRSFEREWCLKGDK
jgi:lysozyme